MSNGRRGRQQCGRLLDPVYHTFERLSEGHRQQIVSSVRSQGIRERKYIKVRRFIICLKQSLQHCPYLLSGLLFVYLA